MPSKKVLDQHYIIEFNDIKHAKGLGIVFSKHIGKGVFSDVYEAKYNSEIVALKVNHKSKCNVNTLNEEIKVSNILKLKTHKNIIKFLNIFENSNKTQFWLLMEWIDGQDMKEVMIKQNKEFDEKVAKYYFFELINGLQFLHSMGIVHRDIKPSNILISCDQTLDQQIVKYIDFGFAKLVSVSDDKAICSSHKGSQIYMAPELLSKKKIKYDAFKTDIYSLAIVLFEMLFKNLPFGASDMGIDAEDRNELMIALKENLVLRYPEEIDVSNAVKELIEKMICKESDQRLSAQQILDSNWFKDYNK